MWPIRQRLSSILLPSAKHQPKVQNHGHGASVLHDVPVYSLAHAGTKLYCLVTEAMYVNHLPKVALDSTATGVEPVVSNHNSTNLTTVPLSHTEISIGFLQQITLTTYIQYICLSQKLQMSKITIKTKETLTDFST